MDTNKLRVVNNTKHDIGVRIINDSHWSEFNIPGKRDNRPGGFLMMTLENIEMLKSTTTLFDEGELILEKEDPIVQDFAETIGLDLKAKKVTITEEEVKKMLAGKIPALTKWLDELSDWQIEDVYDIALKLDLPVSKMKVIKEKVPVGKVLLEEAKEIDAEEKAKAKK